MRCGAHSRAAISGTRRSISRNRWSPGIWTVDRAGGKGYNSGHNGDGDTAGNFTATFGGTSSACPGAAGVAALVLSVNPSLKWNEVRDVLKRSCDRIDPTGGGYNSGTGHSAKYGFGRINALARFAAQPQSQNVLNVGRTFDLPIRTCRPCRLRSM